MSEFLTEDELAHLHADVFRAVPGYGKRLGFTVHCEPLPHQSFRVSRFGHFKPTKMRRYQNAIADSARMSIAKQLSWNKQAVYLLSVRAYRSTRRKCDVDNLIKPVSDALNGIVWLDDQQVQMVACAKFIDKTDPRTVVLVQQLLSS